MIDFEEDSAVLEGLNDRANDLGFDCVEEALDEVEQIPGG